EIGNVCATRGLIAPRRYSKQFRPFSTAAVGVQNLNIEVRYGCCVGDRDVGGDFCAADKRSGIHGDAARVGCACNEPLRLRPILEALAVDSHTEVDGALFSGWGIGSGDLNLALGV